VPSREKPGKYHPRCRAVLSPQSGLLRKNREKWASFAYFEGKAGGISLQLGLAGGGSVIRTRITFLNSATPDVASLAGGAALNQRINGR
jgi:hypothetical protein